MISATTLALIIQGFQAAVAESPAAIQLAQQFKDFISGLFDKGLITAEQQQKVHDHVDAIAAAFANGTTPPAWQVEPDPN